MDLQHFDREDVGPTFVPTFHRHPYLILSKDSTAAPTSPSPLAGGVLQSSVMWWKASLELIAKALPGFEVLLDSIWEASLFIREGEDICRCAVLELPLASMQQCAQKAGLLLLIMNH